MGKKKAPKPQSGKSLASVGELRKRLRQLDRTLLLTMNERAVTVEQIAALAAQRGKVIADQQLVTEAIRTAIADNPGPLADRAVMAAFRELVSGCSALVQPTRVAYLGPDFTFSHLAALERFGESVQLVPLASIRAVFEEVERGEADFGVVPMENSTDGRVSDTLECFARSKLRICGEVPLRIHHCLMASGRLDEIQLVHSKPQALSQCRHWLSQHLPAASQRPVASTAEAAIAAQADASIGAIGSEKASAAYSLNVLARNIEDSRNNITRFAVIGTMAGERTGKDKTALLLEIAHQPGALADTMAVFKRNRLNMTWIESFPILDCPGRYLFFIEFVGHQKELRSRRAIEAISKKSLRLDVLGSYAQTEPIG